MQPFLKLQHYISEKRLKKMSIEKSVKEEHLDLLTQNYMDKLFYFSLKKTGNSFEAENLAQDILLNIITSLERGNNIKQNI